MKQYLCVSLLLAGLLPLRSKAQQTTVDILTARQHVSTWVIDPVPGDKFTYDNKDMPHYGIKWAADTWVPGAPSLWVSGHAGIKFFTRGSPEW